MSESSILRLGLFYDGAFFQRISDYYLHHHPRRSRLSFTGLHDFLREETAARMDTDPARTRVVEAHYYRGRLPTRMATERDVVVGERSWDESLMYAGIEPHYQPLLVGSGGRLEEKGIDVALALDAYDLARRAEIDVLVLLAGDGDFYPLLRRLHATGTATLLPVWDVDYVDDRGGERQLRAAGRLRAEATWSVDMPVRIEALARTHPIRVASLFVSRRESVVAERPSPASEGPLEEHDSVAAPVLPPDATDAGAPEASSRGRGALPAAGAASGNLDYDAVGYPL